MFCWFLVPGSWLLLSCRHEPAWLLVRCCLESSKVLSKAPLTAPSTQQLQRNRSGTKTVLIFFSLIQNAGLCPNLKQNDDDDDNNHDDRRPGRVYGWIY